MDTAQLDLMTNWIRDNFGRIVRKDELVAKAAEAELPQEAQKLMRDLCEGEYDKGSLIETLTHQAEERFGAGQSTTAAAKQGGGGVSGE